MPQEGGTVEGVSIPIHFFTLVALGVHLFDNMGLEEVAGTARELNRWEFLFMASPHGVPNGAGLGSQSAGGVLAAKTPPEFAGAFATGLPGSPFEA